MFNLLIYINIIKIIVAQKDGKSTNKPQKKCYPQ